MNDNTRRLEYVDLLRSVGIIVMIMGHIGYGSIFDKLIHSFHMQLFFFVAGYFFSFSSSPIECAKKRVKTLILPYFVFGVFHYVFYCFWLWTSGSQITIDPLIALVTFNNNRGLPIANALWFLTAMFFADIIFCIVMTYIKKEPLQFIAVISIALVGVLLRSWAHIMLPLSMDAGLVGVVFLYVGYFIREKIPQILNLNLGISCGLFIIGMILAYLNGYINFRTGTYGIIPLSFVNTLLILVSLWNLSRITLPKLAAFSNGKISRLVCVIGRNSITYLCLNQLIILLCSKMIGVLRMPVVISHIILLPIVLIVLYYIDWVLQNTRLKVILGK